MSVSPSHLRSQATGPVRTCRHQRECGGCPLIESPYAEQLEAKRVQVHTALARFGSLRDEVVRLIEPALPSPLTTGYRTRAKVVVQGGDRPGDGRGGEVRIGLYQPGGHTLVDLPDCAVLPDGTRAILELLRCRLTTMPELLAKVRHAVVRWSFFEGRGHLVLVVEAERRSRPRGLDDLARAMLADPGVRLAGVAYSEQRPGPAEGARGADGPAIQVLGSRIEPVLGEQELIESLGTQRFRVSPGAFFQANLAQAERIIGLCDGWFGEPGPGSPSARPRGTLVDLYAGVGTLSIGLGRHFERVIAVEAHGGASEDARHNAHQNGLGHVEIRLGYAENRVLHLSRELGRARAVVMNPPRRGCKPEVLRAAAELRPDRMAYVACDPETLGRDLDRLAGQGYVARRVIPIDMFPQTAHVETVALLERAGRSAPPGRGALAPGRAASTTRPARPRLTVVHEDDDLIVVVKPGHLAVHGGTGHEADSVEARILATASGSDKWVPLTRLDIGSSGLVVFGRHLAINLAFLRLAEAGAVDRRLLALVRGHLRPRGTINRALVDRRSGRSQPATTRYRRTAEIGGHSLCEVELCTARPHQARRHLAAIGHPVIGDGRYGDRRTNRHFEEKLALWRPFIHLGQLGFPHPRTGRYLVLSAPLADDLELCLHRLATRPAGGPGPGDL